MSRISRGSTPRISRLKSQAELTIPFSEWIDSEIHTEKWDFRETKKLLTAKKLSSKLSTTSENTDADVFSDSHMVHLPKSIEVIEWKRLSEIYENVEFIISKPHIDFTSLREGSIHVLHSQFMRSFINSICILEYIGITKPWEIESVSHNYLPNTDNLSWKPWHHIYSLCGAGKGQTHSPKYNPSGKYIVRLYWLGTWRKIYVDDKLPINEDKDILLPGFKFQKQKSVEKIPSNLEKTTDATDKTLAGSQPLQKNKKSSSKSSKGGTQTKSGIKESIPEVEIWPYILSKALLKIACLTWTDECEIFDFNPISCLTGWICQKVDTAELSTTDIWDICVAYSSKFEWEENGDKQIKISKGNKVSKKSKGTAKKTSGDKNSNSEKEKNYDIKVKCLVGSCKSVKNFIKELDIENIPSEWNQEFLIEQSRDKPLHKPEPKPELARWKRFRWLKWAISKGLWSSDDSSIPIRCLKFYNNFKINQSVAVTTTTKREKSKTGGKIGSKNSKGGKNSTVPGKNGDLKIFPLIEQSVWVDFADVEIHIDTLYIFFRPSQFIGRVDLSSPTYLEQITHPTKDKTKKHEEKPHELKWSLNIKESRNTPIYLLMDSLEQKLLIISLSQVGHINRIHPIAPINEEPYANIVLEEFVWQENRIGAIHVFLTTIGSKTILLYPNPGRVIYKLWIWCNNNYFLNILSNIPITVGNIDCIFDGMCGESLLLGKVSQEVGTTFGNLVRAFGTPTYLEEIRKFCKTYTADLHLTKIESKQLYCKFMDTLLRYLESKEAAWALKVLFIDPNISCKRLKESVSVDNTSDMFKNEIISNVSYDENSKSKIQERAAIRIQSILKCIYVRKILEIHKQSNKKYYEVYEELKKIYYEIFSDNKRSVCMKLLKQFTLGTKHLHNTYLYEELLKTIDIKTYKGNVIISENSNGLDTWVFITRQKFINKSLEPLAMRAVLSINLPKYIVRIFNNDDLQEVKRLTNNVEGYYYPPNQKGYTVLCYGWSSEATKINWKLYLVFQKIATQSFITSEELLDIKTLSHCYLPNVNANVCRCKLEISQNADLTFRLSTSGTTAELELVIRDSWNQILGKIQGTQNVILPLVRLRCVDSDEENEFHISEVRKPTKLSAKTFSKQRLSPIKPAGPTCAFYVEASVLNGTWPLTKKEWLNVKMERNKFLKRPPSIPDSPQRITSKRRPTSMPTDLHPQIDHPFWTLQVIHNIGENLHIERDLTRQKEINDTKESWYSEDPERYEKSEEIRQSYLQELCLQACEISDSDISLNTASEIDAPLNQWIPETMMLKAFNLSKYHLTEPEEPVHPDPITWECSLLDKSRDEINTLQFTLSQCRERMDRVENDQTENFIILRQWYDECRADSAELMKSSYTLREKFIDMVIEQNMIKGTKEKENNKKNKGDKKGKKGK